MRYLLILTISIFFAACGAGAEVKNSKNGEPTPSAERAAESFDTVAYFTVRKAIKGLPQFSIIHDGAEYVFSNKANREAFEMNPEKYIPGYGTYCPVSLSKGSKVKGKPSTWRVYKDQLYWFYSDDYAEEFDEDPEKILKEADDNSK